MKKPTEMTPEECKQALEVEDFSHTGGGVRKHWLEVKAGLKPQSEGVGKRGPDGPTSPRQVRKQVSVAKRYFDTTGRSIEQDMAASQAMIAAMAEAVDEMDDPMDKFKAMEAVAKMQSDFNKTWLPYLEMKLGTMQTETKVEDLDLDTLLSAPVEE